MEDTANITVDITAAIMVVTLEDTITIIMDIGATLDTDMEEASVHHL